MAGPTVLEVFNTLLKHLRMSVDFELGDSSRRNSASSVSSVRGKESEERIVQNAIIQTIGTSSSITPVFVLMNMCLHVLVKITLNVNVFFIHWVLTHLFLSWRRRQASSVEICQTTSELKSWCSSWAKCQSTGRPATPWTQSRLGESHIHYPETRRFPRRAAASQLTALKRRR